MESETLRHMIWMSKRGDIKDSGYYFCKASDCETVYYHSQSGQCFEKSDLMIRVGVKETDDPVWVCYCFDISKKMIADEIEQSGKSFLGQRVRREVAVGNCDCQLKNPSGRCCLGEVLAVEKQTQARRKISPSV